MEWYFVKLVLWLFTAYGISSIVTESTLFRPLRNVMDGVPFFGGLLQCILCFSVWVCGFMAIFFWSPFIVFLPNSLLDFPIWGNVVHFILAGAFGSSVVWFISVIEKKLMD